MGMKGREFWPRAWWIEERLRRADPESDPEAANVVAGLRDDLVIQRLVFVERGWAESIWFPVFRRERLFDDPPAVERVEGGLRAVGWPALAYLSNIAPNWPEEVAEILRGLRTDNWWVVSDGLNTAATLPADLAEDAILGLLVQWQQTPVQWTSPSVLGDVFRRLGEDTGGASRLAEATFRVVSSLLTVSQRRYDLEEIVKRVMEGVSPSLHGRLADGIELSLLFALATPGVDEQRWIAPVLGAGRSERSYSADSFEVLIETWVDILEQEAKQEGSGPGVLRATRLWPAGPKVLRQMALWALRTALDKDASDPAARELLRRFASTEEILKEYQLRSEATDLLSRYWKLLPPDSRAQIIDVLSADANSGERGARYRARDWFGALREYLGPREEISLNQLERELGNARTGPVEEPLPEMVWVGPRGPVTNEDVSRLSAREILALMLHTPGATAGEIYGASPEGLGRQVQGEVQRRVAEFLPVLPEISNTVPYGSVIYHVVAGLSQAFKEPEGRTTEALAAILGFLRVVVDRAQEGGLRGEEEYPVGPSAVVGAVAGLLEDLADWILAGDGEIVAELLARCIADEEPTRDYEARFGGENMDPPTLALNSARGKGLRAAFALLSGFWRDETLEGPLREKLEHLIGDVAASEPSPSVRSVFGLYLPQLIMNWQTFWEESQDLILPTAEDRRTQWDAVFTTYLLFYRPHVRVASTLESHYRSAIDWHAEDGSPFLARHVDQLIRHLVALSLAEVEEREMWFGLVLSALNASDEEMASGALVSLGHSIEAQDIAVTESWLLSLASSRLSDMRRARKSRGHESKALAQVIVASRMPVTTVGGTLLDLMGQGGVPEWNEILDYLKVADTERGILGAQILAKVVTSESFDRFPRDDEQLRSLIRDYSGSAPQEMWSVVNLLGQQGRFSVEEEARQLARRITEVGGETN